MTIIPVINCDSAKCVRKKLEALKKFVPRVTRVHCDVGEKPVSKIRIPLFSRVFSAYANRFSIELHCMVSEKHFFSKTHASKGVKLVYYHLREIHNMERFELHTHAWKKKGIEIGVVVQCDDSLHNLVLPKGIKRVLVLGVHSGPAGQKFNPRALRVISFLKKKFPYAILTVDGGITPAIARKLSRVEVSRVTSSAYIWESAQPQNAYQRLLNSK